MLKDWPYSGSTEVIAFLVNNSFTFLFIITDSFCEFPFPLGIGFWKSFNNSGFSQLYTISKTFSSLDSVFRIFTKYFILNALLVAFLVFPLLFINGRVLSNFPNEITFGETFFSRAVQEPNC